MPQEELVQKLYNRIQLLVDEVERLTKLLETNVAENHELRQRNQLLLEKYQQCEQELAESQQKLNLAFRHNVKDHLQQIQEGRQHIVALLSEQRNDQPNQNQALYQFCQQKSAEAQRLRSCLDQMEHQNALLHADNTRLRSYIQHEKMFRQLEQFAGNQQRGVDTPNLQLDAYYDPKHLQEYIDTRSES